MIRMYDDFLVEGRLSHRLFARFLFRVVVINSPVPVADAIMVRAVEILRSVLWLSLLANGAVNSDGK